MWIVFPVLSRSETPLQLAVALPRFDLGLESWEVPFGTRQVGKSTLQVCESSVVIKDKKILLDVPAY